MNPNPRLRVADAAAAARQLPECAALMTSKRKRVIPSAKPLAARPAVQVPAALAVVLVCMLTSCVGSPGHEGQVLSLWLILLGLGLTIYALQQRRKRQRKLAAPPMLFSDAAALTRRHHARSKAALEALQQAISARPNSLIRDCETLHSARRS